MIFYKGCWHDLFYTPKCWLTSDRKSYRPCMFVEKSSLLSANITTRQRKREKRGGEWDEGVAIVSS